MWDLDPAQNPDFLRVFNDNFRAQSLNAAAAPEADLSGNGSEAAQGEAMQGAEAGQAGMDDLEIRPSYVSQKGQFKDDLRRVREGSLPTHAVLNLGSPSKTLKDVGIKNDIVLRQSILKKILNHGFGWGDIEKLEREIQKPIAIIEYNGYPNTFDLLLEAKLEGKPVIASIRIGEKSQGYGDVSDFVTAHPKESLNRIISNIQKHKVEVRSWDKGRGHNYLQGSAPDDWLQFEDIIMSSLNAQSQKASESQWENSKNFDGGKEAGFKAEGGLADGVAAEDAKLPGDSGRIISESGGRLQGTKLDLKPVIAPDTPPAQGVCERRRCRPWRHSPLGDGGFGNTRDERGCVQQGARHSGLLHAEV